MVQFGSTLRWGRRGREFESHSPDHFYNRRRDEDRQSLRLRPAVGSLVRRRVTLEANRAEAVSTEHRRRVV